jgi:pre-mRNA-splicing factor CWC22
VSATRHSATFANACCRCVHKVLKMGIEGLELEVANMIVECCSQERTYLRFYGLLAERFCKLKPVVYQVIARC